MASEVRKKLHNSLPLQENGQQELQNATGINLETDIDRIVACALPGTDRADGRRGGMNGSGMVLARGHFDEVRIESLMRQHGAEPQDYNGSRLIVATMPNAESTSLSLAFLEHGLAAIGSTTLIKNAVDLHKSGDHPTVQSATENDELMGLVKALDSGNNVWAVGRFDALTAQAHLPQDVASKIPAITWFSIGAHIDGGIRGSLRAETRDEEAANNLRDVVRGFLALAKMNAGSRPDIQTMMQSLDLGGTGKTVALSFTVPAEVFDAIGKATQKQGPPQARFRH
ncbi:MAG TPA: hypothetical protein VEU08_14170, partial [Vicinamibacterales bacterium]|nr:hypothetical protein [Vicinamibacterales bacterium]